MPRVQDQTGISNGRLGFALLFVGAGALPAMLLAGRALDRWGLRVAAGPIGLLGIIGIALALTAVDLTSLCVGLTIVGASSGAADVTMNAVAGRAEETTGRPVITRAHATFSAFVVLSSLGTGVAAAAAWPLTVPFLGVAVLSVTAGAAMLTTLPPQQVASRDSTRLTAPSPPGRSGVLPLLPLGALGALAFASENAHQSWSAVFAQDQLHAGAGLTTVAPAVFAGTVAITRFATGQLKGIHAQTIILAGSLAAACGSLIIAAAPALPVAAVGLVLAGAGTAVLFPALLGIMSRNVEESYRGRATSVVTTISYMGFLISPVYVGLWAQATGLRGAMTAIAGLTIALFLLTPLLLGLSRTTSNETPPPAHERQ